MNRKLWMMVMATMMVACPMQAQEDSGIGEAVSKVWNNTKKKVRNSTRRVKENFNINDAAADLREIEGHKYMQLYRQDLYKGAEATDFKEQCMMEFHRKYPEVEVMSCVIPQADWENSTIRSATGKVKKYAKIMYCYILAKDGSDGFINARFSFRQLKKVGGKWKNDASNWPNWERTDVMTPDVYKQLKNE